MEDVETTAKPTKDRLQDVYPDIIGRFYNTEEFLKFAGSKHGLGLPLNDLNTIRENNPGNCYRVKHEALQLWSTYKGENATEINLRKAAETYFEHYVPSDAASFGDQNSPDVDVSPSENDFTQTQQDQAPTAKSNIHITNISGSIQGPVFMGNESVRLGGGNGGMFATSFNEGVPPLKPSSTEMVTEAGQIVVGGASLNYPGLAVTDAKPVTLNYQVDLSPSPAGCIRASSMLRCEPTLKCRRLVEVCLPTFCSTKKSVFASVFKKSNEEEWEFLDEANLVEDRKIFASAREVTNMAAFVAKDRVEDLKFSVAPFLFNNADGKFVMGFCLDDEAIKAAFCHRITASGFGKTLHIPDVIQVCVEDEIQFHITPGQFMANTKMAVDLKFVSSVEGFMSSCNLDKDAVDPRYFISHHRQGKILNEFVYGVKAKDKISKQREAGSIIFKGAAEIGNVISSVDYAEIDQRKYQDGTGAVRGNDKVRYCGSEDSAEEKPSPNVQFGASGTASNIGGGIVFHGKPTIGNIVHNARHVKIDQRNMSRSNTAAPERLVIAQKPEDDQGKADDHQKTISTVTSASGDVDNDAKPISLDCEKKGVESSTVAESGEVDDEAKPIWPDCESRDATQATGVQQSEDEIDGVKETSSDVHEEQPDGKIEAGPIRNESSESSEDSDAGAQIGPASGIREVDVGRSIRQARKRKGQPGIAQKIEAVVVPDDEDPIKKPENFQSFRNLDTVHYALLAIIALLVFWIIYLQF